MGYYTRFYLSVTEGDADLDLVVEKLNVIVANGEYPLFYCEDDHITTDDVMKWYDHDEDCSLLSQTFPDSVFCLEGEGEEAGDMWKTYYKNGLIQICRGVMTYPDYDVAKLAPVADAHTRDSGR